MFLCSEKLGFLFCVSSILFGDVSGLGCIKGICSDPSNTIENQIVKCSIDGYCGIWKSLRRNQQLIEAVDLKCQENRPIHAPFDGELTYYQPLGSEANDLCGANEGIKITGHGQWRGYYVIISTVKAFKYGGSVKAGEIIGKAGNLDCTQSAGFPYENFVRFQLFRNGKPIDPTNHLIDCMCTGQICETNGNNAYVGQPFKFDSRYNGFRGWELKCHDKQIEMIEGYSSEEGFEQNTSPRIFSPIEGSVIGRMRLDNSPGESYSGCENDGIFIVGSGKWIDYEVRIMNARFSKNLVLGQQLIEQGQHIGYRLNCPNSPESIFLEVRFQGMLIDITQALIATDCRHQKKFNRLISFQP